MNMIYSLEEAIKHCEEVANNLELEAKCIRSWGKENDTKQGAINCEKCANEHRQLAEWLRELQRWRKLKSAIIPKYRDGVLDEYNMGANDMWNEIMERIEEVNADGDNC